MIATFLRLAQRAARAGRYGLAFVLCRLAGVQSTDAPAPFNEAVDLLLQAGAWAQAEALCRLRLQLRAEDAPALVRLAYILLDSGRAAEAVECFREIDRRDGAGNARAEYFQNRHLDLARAQAGEPYYVWLENVRIETAFWSILKDRTVYNADVHARNLAASPYIRGRVSADGSTVVASLPAPACEIAGECIMIGGDENYSHWLFRNTLKMCSLDRAGLLFSHPWLVNSDLQSYQLEYMQLLGQTPERLLRVDRHTVVKCARVLVPALLVSKQAVRQGVQWLREKVAHLCVPQAQATRLLFVSRRDNGRRKLLNEEELFAALAPLGFERVVPGELSVAEQIGAFSSARFIVAPHGAGLTNMFFTPAGAAILELTSTAIAHIDHFRIMAGAAGHAIETISSDDYDVPVHEARMHSDYSIDVNRVVRKVEAMLATAVR